MLSSSIESTIAHIEDVATLESLCDKHARLSIKYELEGDYEAAAAHEMAASRLAKAKSAIEATSRH